MIVGGCDNGLVQMYSASKLLKNEESLISRQDKHTGPVHALDFNPFQQNLLATGAAESEIYIWDLNNTTTPMTPGSKAQPLEDVQWISWNRQVCVLSLNLLFTTINLIILKKWSQLSSDQIFCIHPNLISRITNLNLFYAIIIKLG